MQSIQSPHAKKNSDGRRAKDKGEINGTGVINTFDLRTPRFLLCLSLRTLNIFLSLPIFLTGVKERRSVKSRFWQSAARKQLDIESDSS